MADAFYIVVGAVSTLWNRLTSVPPIEWIATCATFATLALIFIWRHVERIRELMEGPTGRCRYCQRRYASPEHRGFLDRTCDRRACRRQYAKYVTELHKAQDAVLRRWKAIPAEADGALSTENLKLRDEELAESHETIDRRYGGEPEGRRDE